jgi:hypothetical protein
MLRGLWPRLTWITMSALAGGSCSDGSTGLTDDTAGLEVSVALYPEAHLTVSVGGTDLPEGGRVGCCEHLAIVPAGAQTIRVRETQSGSELLNFSATFGGGREHLLVLWGPLNALSSHFVEIQPQTVPEDQQLVHCVNLTQALTIDCYVRDVNRQPVAVRAIGSGIAPGAQASEFVLNPDEGIGAVYEPVAVAADGPVQTINSETTGSSSTQQYYFLVDTEEDSGARLWAGSGYPRGY